MMMFTDLIERSGLGRKCAYGAMVMGPEVGKSRVRLRAEDQSKFSGNAKPLLRM